jgi:hypothetical protein
MKRILITKDIIELSKTYANKLVFKDKQSNFKKPLDNFKQLKGKLKGELNNNQTLTYADDYADYVQKIIDLYPIE